MDRFVRETYQGIEFMPAQKSMDFYFGKSFRPAAHELYLPEKSYQYYGLPAKVQSGLVPIPPNSLGQINSTGGLDSFKDLATLGLTVFGTVQQAQVAREQIKAQVEVERIKAEALAAVAKQQASAQPIIIPQAQASGPSLGLILGGTAFVGVIGTIMIFLMKK